ncbi:MAG TPA: hypothetical protein DEA73_09165, partial [Peptococcaceae bacterium]|nr:hypothetical protein [Peptococcaceae bacterium]
ILEPVRQVVEVCAVPNRFFGGSIACAGLLTVADFVQGWEEKSRRKCGVQPDLILLPGV